MKKPTSLKFEEAKKLLIKIHLSSIGQWAFLIAGWVFISLRLLFWPFKFEFKWVIFYIITVFISAAVHPLFVFIYSKVKKGSRKWLEVFNADNYGAPILTEIKYKQILPTLKFPLRYIIDAPAEDGLFLVPLLYTGINVYTAAVSAILFAASHYPRFNISFCIPKGVAYFFVALLILPNSDIAPIIVGHILIDLVLGYKMIKTPKPFKLYYDNGVLKEEGYYITLLSTGKWRRVRDFKAYYPSGKLHREYFFSSKGKLNGLARDYNEDGTLKIEGTYKDGKRLDK